MMIMCGMSTCFAALFGTPLTATIFAIEVVSVGVMHYAALVPCVLGALIGYGIAQIFEVAPTAFVIQNVPQLGLASTVQVIVLSILCAVLSAIFCISMHAAGKLYKKYISNAALRAAVGGVLVILLTLLVGNRDYNGAGMDVITRAMAGEADWCAFLLKILFTAVTLGAGFKGGEIVPTFFNWSDLWLRGWPVARTRPLFCGSSGIDRTVLRCHQLSGCFLYSGG